MKHWAPTKLQQIFGLYCSSMAHKILQYNNEERHDSSNNKGDITLCSNYRGIKLSSPTLKLWERILNRRFLDIWEITTNQFVFTPSKSFTDAIQTVRILMKKHRGNKKDLYSHLLTSEKRLIESQDDSCGKQCEDI